MFMKLIGKSNLAHEQYADFDKILNFFMAQYYK